MSCDRRCGGGCSEGVSVIDEVVLGHDAVWLIGAEVDRESASAGRSRGEAIAVL